MSSTELSLFTSVYVSQEMQQAIDIFENNNFNKLKEILGQNLDSLNVTEFSQICNAVAFAGNPQT